MIAKLKKRTNYKHVYAIFYDNRVDTVMSAAARQGVTGPGYLYLFPGLDIFWLEQRLAQVEDGAYTNCFLEML